MSDMTERYDGQEPDKPSFLSRIFDWFTARPLLGGFIAGALALILIAVMVSPAHEPSAPVPDVSVRVTAPEILAPEPGKPMDDNAQAPSADVPVVAEAAVLITDVGLNRRIAENIDKQMPRDISLAISPYATDPAGTATAFKASGRDVWLEMAAQSVRSGIDPGPLAIAGGLSAEDNMNLIKRQIGNSGGSAIGIYIPDDADITFESDMWKGIAMNLIGENQMILDGTPAKVATELYVQKAESQISAYLKGDKVINGDAGPAAIAAELDKTIPLILSERQAIIIVTQPTTLAVDNVAEWIKGLATQGIRLVPASRFTGLKP